MRAQLETYYEAKFAPRQDQVTAVLKLVKVYEELLAENEAPEAEKLPLVLLAQFGCGMGKSVIESLLAKHLVAQDPHAKVLVCAPAEWVSYQLSDHFRSTKIISQIQKSSGIFLIEHLGLDKLTEEELRETIIIADEVDILLKDS